MFSLSKDKLRRTLRSVGAVALSGLIAGFGSTAHAAESASDNTVEITSNDYKVNDGKSTVHSGQFSDVIAGRSGAEYYFSDLLGGSSDSGDASGNTLTISDVNITGGEIIAGGTNIGNANNNKTVIDNVNAPNVFLHAGYAYGGNGDANNNTVIMNGGTVAHIHAGHSSNGNANGNTAIVNGGTVTSLVGAGYAHTGDTNKNVLELNGGAFYGNVHGGYTSNGANANNNTVTINGGDFSGDIYGGWAPNGNTIGNTLNVYGSPNLSNSTLYAGKSSPSGISSGNSLNIYTKDLTAKNIDGFESLNFYMPKDTANGDKLLTLTDTAGTDLSNTTVNVASTGATGLNSGDSVTLISNNGGIITSNVTNSGVLAEGVSLDYNLGLNPVTDSSGKIVSITATVGERIGSGLKPQTEALAQATLTGPNLLNFGTDRVMRWLPPEDDSTGGESDDLDGDIDSARSDYTIFANANAGHYRIKTGNGSYITSDSNGIDLGAARMFENGSGKLYVAPLIDYGQDSYDSYLSDGLRGSGGTKYFAGGFIARQSNDNGFYYEGSFRYGRVKTEFSSSDFMMNGVKTPIYYETSAPAWAGHVNIGLRYKVDDNNILDLYGIYYHSHQGDMEATLPTGETYQFDAITNRRFRVGARLTRATGSHSRFYSGIAYQYESAGAARGTYRGLSTPESGTNGSSFMLELGWQYKPSKDNPWMVDVGAVGWLGHQKGFSIGAKMKKEF